MIRLSNITTELQKSLYSGFVDRSHLSGKYPAQLLANSDGNDVLTELVQELQMCKGFMFSVAFITESGLATIKSHLLDLKQKGVKGRIITSDYLGFNTPEVFEELLKLENVDVRITNVKGFHAKGYIFQHTSYSSLIVGSSNLTAHALKENYEWNLYFTSHENGKVIHDFTAQFDNMWESSTKLTPSWIEKYKVSYVPFDSRVEAQKIAEHSIDYNGNDVIDPNQMQLLALQSIQNVRKQGSDKGLVISATGTGKTYLSAFDVKQFNPKRMLFIAHREQILRKSLEDFHRVIGGNYNDYGILSGNKKDVDATYLFSTIQTISKENILERFDSDAFDYIIIDEVHKSGAKSYLRVIDHFSPKFLLGMTATPDRTDDFNIYELFNYNIAYEIRLQEALEEKMLCPFHYFGVVDMDIENKTTENVSLFNKLTSDNRVEHILEKALYYGYSGKKLKGLIFCSRKEEAHELSSKFNDRGLKTVTLTGEDSLEERERRIEQLENGELHYIFTVDVFNEGIDIPKINQIIMLRQTQSSIVFIQQLGRGLRKESTKEYLTVIDFIGNYKNNYLIPIALSGDSSLNKDNVRRNMKDTSYIKGVSTINFEEIARDRIFKSISETNLTHVRVIREAYQSLKNKIGRIPNLIDFIEHYSIDPIVILEKYKTYPHFLHAMKEEVNLSEKYQLQVLEMLSNEIANGKRGHEIILLDLLYNEKKISCARFKEALIAGGYSKNKHTIDSVKRVLNLEFFTNPYQNKYGARPLVVEEDGFIQFNNQLEHYLEVDQQFNAWIKDLIFVGKSKCEKFDRNNHLTLYKKYSRKEVCKLLEWESDESSTMFGYKTKHGTCPIFITYDKEHNIESSVNYGDELISDHVLHWFTRSNRTLKSTEVQKIINAEQNNIDLHIFVKKDNDEGRDFYYLGKAHPDQDSILEDEMDNGKGKMLPVVRMNLNMENTIEHRLFHYLTTTNVK